jgi:hypothetical protein
MELAQAERLGGFLSQWQTAREGHEPEARLARFLEAFRPLRPERALSIFSPRRADPASLSICLGEMRQLLESQRAKGNVIDPWAIARVRRSEVVNSAILATFWSPRSCGNLARRFLDAFCRRLEDPEGKLPTSEELAEAYSIRTEHCPVGEASERVDITIEGRTFVLGIEVKIDAKEGAEQLPRYLESVKRWGGTHGRRPCVVFLAPIEPSVPEVIRAGWSDVAAAGRQVLAQAAGERTSHRFMLENFVRHCRKFGG